LWAATAIGVDDTRTEGAVVADGLRRYKPLVVVGDKLIDYGGSVRGFRREAIGYRLKRCRRRQPRICVVTLTLTHPPEPTTISLR
jgi:hypothetical protein